MLNLDDRLIKNSTVVTREADGELVVVLPDRGKFIVLNTTGARVMQLADGARSLQDIAALIAEEFGVDTLQVETDVLRFAAMLCERQVLTPVARSAS